MENAWHRAIVGSCNVDWDYTFLVQHYVPISMGKNAPRNQPFQTPLMRPSQARNFDAEVRMNGLWKGRFLRAWLPFAEPEFGAGKPAPRNGMRCLERPNAVARSLAAIGFASIHARDADIAM